MSLSRVGFLASVPSLAASFQKGSALCKLFEIKKIKVIVSSLILLKESA